MFVYIIFVYIFLGEQFVTQNRGINSGKDIPRDILEMIYDSIKGEPFKIPDESYDDLMYTFFSPEKEGWLLKQGGGYVMILFYFHKRFFMKMKNILYLKIYIIYYLRRGLSDF